MCQDLKCLFYVVEHRFYGDSQPFADWSTANLKYLNSTQALADLKNFIVTTDAQLVEKYGGKPRKWVTIGGSYPGALSAWFN
jgi:Serine carboxypeptidase S28